MPPQGLHVLRHSPISRFHMFGSPISFFSENINNTAPTEGWIYPINRRNSWQYSAGLHQNAVLCRHTSPPPFSPHQTNAADCEHTNTVSVCTSSLLCDQSGNCFKTVVCLHTVC
jgi:hypothetical protein